jgi:hypothetical protein
MPQLGSEKNPMVITRKKTGRTLGLMGRWYTKENRDKYAENYHRIFGNKTEDKKDAES